MGESGDGARVGVEGGDFGMGIAVGAVELERCCVEGRVARQIQGLEVVKSGALAVLP